MRIAIVSDIHGNRTAFEAVLADLRQTSPDLILHGGDLAGPGSSPVEIVDRLQELGWPGIVGNTDEMLFDPASLQTFSAHQSAQYKALFDATAEMAAFTQDLLGDHRLAWLRALPRMLVEPPLALVHASPLDLWRAPADANLESTFRPLGQPVAVYAHIHHPFIRTLPALTIANTGSAGAPYDGDPRAAYLLIDDGRPAIRRVEYDLQHELTALASSGLPYAGWLARTLTAAAPQPF